MTIMMGTFVYLKHCPCRIINITRRILAAKDVTESPPSSFSDHLYVVILQYCNQCSAEEVKGLSLVSGTYANIYSSCQKKRTSKANPQHTGPDWTRIYSSWITKRFDIFMLYFALPSKGIRINDKVWMVQVIWRMSRYPMSKCTNTIQIRSYSIKSDY